MSRETDSIQMLINMHNAHEMVDTEGCLFFFFRSGESAVRARKGGQSRATRAESGLLFKYFRYGSGEDDETEESRSRVGDWPSGLEKSAMIRWTAGPSLPEWRRRRGMVQHHVLRWVLQSPLGDRFCSPPGTPQEHRASSWVSTS